MLKNKFSAIGLEQRTPDIRKIGKREGAYMKNMMKYKGYYGSVHYNDDDQIFHGKLEFIRALINYKGENVKGLKKSFEKAVNDYLNMCEKEEIGPEKPFKGSFNVRTGSTLHRRATLFAKKQGINLNNVIIDALDQYLSTHHA